MVLVKIIAIISIVFVFSGCTALTRNWLPSPESKVTPPEPTPVDRRSPVQKVLDSWINQPESQLIYQWGIPDKQMTTEENGKIYEYKKCNSPVATTYGNAFRIGNAQMINTNQTTVYSQGCYRWTFLIQDGVVLQSRFTPE